MTLLYPFSVTHSHRKGNQNRSITQELSGKAIFSPFCPEESKNSYSLSLVLFCPLTRLKCLY